MSSVYLTFFSLKLVLEKSYAQKCVWRDGGWGVEGWLF